MRHTVLAVTAVLVASCTSSPQGAEVSPCALGRVAGLGDVPFPRLGNPGYDVRSYDVNLDVDPSRRRFKAESTIVLQARSELRAVVLDAWGVRVGRASIGGAPARVCTVAGKAVLVTRDAISYGEEITLRIATHGWPRPVRKSGAPFDEGLIAGESGARSVGLYGAAASWLPLNATPRDPARFTLRIIVPRPFVAVAGGTLDDRIEAGDGTTFVWRSVGEVSVDAGTLLAVDRFERNRLGSWRDVVLDAYVPPGEGDAEIDGPKVREMLDLFSRRFGPYPFPEMSFVVVPAEGPEAYDGQMRMFRVADLPDDVLAHHVAHQWFEHGVAPPTFAEAWLREGLAAYAEVVWLEHAEGPHTAARRIEEIRDLVGARSTSPLAVREPGDLADPDVLFGRGVLALEALRRSVEDRTFFRIVRRYRQTFAHRRPTTPGFVAVAEKVSGRDLGPWVTEWLSGPTIPARFPQPVG